MKKILFLLIAITFSNLGFSQLNKIHLAYPDTFNIRAVSEKNGTLYCIASRYKTYLFNRTFLLKSTDAGDSWTVLNQFTLTNSPLHYSVVNDSIHYLVTPDLKLLRSTDMCSNFDTLMNIFSVDESFYAINKDTVVANGFVIPNGSHLFSTRDGFQNIDTLKVNSGGILFGYNRSISLINDSVWVTYTYLKQSKIAIIRTNNAGVSWDTVNVLNVGGGIRDISFNNNQGVLLAYSNDYSYKKLYLSLDMGNTFSVVDSFQCSPYNFQEAHICNNGTIYLWGKYYPDFTFAKNTGSGWQMYSLPIHNSDLPTTYNFHAIYPNDTMIVLDIFEKQYGHPPNPSQGFHEIYRLDVNSLSIRSETKTNAEFTVFPNPFNRSINIKTPKTFSGKIRLTDLFGRIIMETEKRNVLSAELNDLNIEPGIYFIELISDKRKSMGVVKIIKF